MSNLSRSQALTVAGFLTALLLTVAWLANLSAIAAVLLAQLVVINVCLFQASRRQPPTVTATVTELYPRPRTTALAPRPSNVTSITGATR